MPVAVLSIRVFDLDLLLLWLALTLTGPYLTLAFASKDDDCRLDSILKEIDVVRWSDGRRKDRGGIAYLDVAPVKESSMFAAMTKAVG